MMSLPVPACHNCTVPSALAEAITLPSDDQAMPLVYSLCPLYVKCVGGVKKWLTKLASAPRLVNVTRNIAAAATIPITNLCHIGTRRRPDFTFCKIPNMLLRLLVITPVSCPLTTAVHLRK